MSAFLSMFKVTLRQLAGRKRVLGFIALCMAPAGLLAAAARAREGAAGLDTDLGALMVAPFLSVVVPLIALILAGAALGDERRDKTLSFLTLRPLSRLRIAGAKTASAAAASCAFAVIGALALCLVFVSGGGNMNVLPAIAVGACLTCVLYTAVFVVVGNVTSKATLIGILYVLFIENALAAEIPRLAPISPWRIGLAATIDLLPDSYPERALLGAIGDLIPSAPNALVAAAVVTLISVGVCTALLARTDSV